eukprot:jgi/Psemu1/50785/gm1.50785_g
MSSFVDLCTARAPAALNNGYKKYFKHKCHPGVENNNNMTLSTTQITNAKIFHLGRVGNRTTNARTNPPRIPSDIYNSYSTR